MDSNRAKVLEMLQQGTISIEQAEALLQRLHSPANGNEPTASEPSGEPHRGRVPAERPIPTSPRFLRVQVNTGDGDRVNIRVPMALIRTGIKLSTLIPQAARESVQAQGIDLDVLTQMDPEELVRALAEMTVDVESHDGSTVQIYCE